MNLIKKIKGWGREYQSVSETQRISRQYDILQDRVWNYFVEHIDKVEQLEGTIFEWKNKCYTINRYYQSDNMFSITPNKCSHERYIYFDELPLNIQIDLISKMI